MQIIYVKLLNEEIEVWRPVVAQHIDKNIFLILKANIQDGEKWEFASGDRVEVQSKQSDGEMILVAKDLVK